MAKPNPQTGHGPFGGTTDESSFAHGEASRGDAEGDAHEGDWDVPTAPDNSPLSRILGLVLVVVLAGVFSFVAYRKYDEARRNPQSLENLADADGSPASSDAPADPATPNTADQSTTAPSPTERPVATASTDAFGSLEEPSPNQSPGGRHHLRHEDQPTTPAASLAQGATTPAVIVTAYRPDLKRWSADFMRRER